MGMGGLITNYYYSSSNDIHPLLNSLTYFINVFGSILEPIAVLLCIPQYRQTIKGWFHVQPTIRVSRVNSSDFARPSGGNYK